MWMITIPLALSARWERRSQGAPVHKLLADEFGPEGPAGVEVLLGSGRMNIPGC
jgi:hypothetical protein